MPCSGCARRRKALLDAWHRVRALALMSNDERRARDRDRLAAEQRNARAEMERRQQQQLMSLARRR